MQEVSSQSGVLPIVMPCDYQVSSDSSILPTWQMLKGRLGGWQLPLVSHLRLVSSPLSTAIPQEPFSEEGGALSFLVLWCQGKILKGLLLAEPPYQAGVLSSQALNGKRPQNGNVRNACLKCLCKEKGTVRDTAMDGCSNLFQEEEQ